MIYKTTKKYSTFKSLKKVVQVILLLRWLDSPLSFCIKSLGILTQFDTKDWKSLEMKRKKNGTTLASGGH